jgi:hypothetical protein
VGRPGCITLFVGKDVAVVRDVAAGLGASLGRIDAAIGALEPSE